ncbi:MAG: AAA family ATPase [Verrucomicrobiota bacterium]
MKFARGLIVGKFAPLHRGHELLIRRAVESCEELFILSYSKPEFAGCEPVKRAHWLEQLFSGTRRLVVGEEWLRENAPDLSMPSNDAPDHLHRRFVGELCRRFFDVTIDAVFTSEDYGDGFASELTAFFREESPAAPEVRHIQVDRDRREIPVSGTAIRAGFPGLLHWLSPVVAESFGRRICLLGGESSGKSTLAARLAAHFSTVEVPEYGRELWMERAGNLRFEEMLEIAECQVAREEAAVRVGHRWVFCDTSPLTTLFYSHALFGRAAPGLEELARRSYRLTVLCAPDIPFIQDGTRRDEGFRARQHDWYLEQLAGSSRPWIVVTGNLPQRVAAVVAALAGLE